MVTEGGEATPSVEFRRGARIDLRKGEQGRGREAWHVLEGSSRGKESRSAKEIRRNQEKRRHTHTHANTNTHTHTREHHVAPGKEKRKAEIRPEEMHERKLRGRQRWGCRRRRSAVTRRCAAIDAPPRGKEKKEVRVAGSRGRGGEGAIERRATRQRLEG